jgi:ABC-type transporter Mla MlaB component
MRRCFHLLTPPSRVNGRMGTLRQPIFLSGQASRIREALLALSLRIHSASTVDGGVMALLVALRTELAQRGVRADISGASADVEPLVELYEANAPPKRRKKRKPESAVEQSAAQRSGWEERSPPTRSQHGA